MLLVSVFRSPKNARPELRSLADEDLMQLVHAGDQRAFEIIFERHSTVAFSLAYRM
jgi:hypothetical protein